MGKSNSNKKVKVKLAHPPGHIFWKKDAPVDKLSIFIERIVEEYSSGNGGGSNDKKRDKQEDYENKSLKDNDYVTSDDERSELGSLDQKKDFEEQKSVNESLSDTTSESHKKTSSLDKTQTEEENEDTVKENEEKVKRVIERILTNLFTDDLMFIKVFEMPPKELTAENGLHFRQIGEKEFECRLFLKRLIDQSSCQLIFGAQSDIPPGMAVYKLNDRMTNEQKAFTKEAWGPCMDEDGHMSPGQMYPWFAMGITNCVQNIIEEEHENASETSSNSKHDCGDFQNIEVAGQFPVVKIAIPLQNDEDDDDSLKQENDCVEKLSLPGSEASSNRSNNREKNDKANVNDKTSTKGKPLKSQAQWYPRGGNAKGKGAPSPVPTPTPRGSLQSGTNTGRTFSSYSSDVGTTTDDIQEEPIIITIKPAIKGYGLPRSIKLQHALPKQKPYCEKGKECLDEIQGKIEDGQSLWYLDACPVAFSQKIENSARFKSMFRKIGRAVNFWSISFEPITEIIHKNMMDAYEKHEFSIDLEMVKSCISIMRTYHGWKCIKGEYIDIGIMNVVKSNMLTMRSVGECTKKVLSFLLGVVSSRSCPNFLQPNVNIAQGMSEKEAEWVATEMKDVIAEIEKDPSFILIYIGYNKKREEEK